jgi:hypothetical protein
MTESIRYENYPTERPKISQFSTFGSTILSILLNIWHHQTTSFSIFAFLHSLGHFPPIGMRAEMTGLCQKLHIRNVRHNRQPKAERRRSAASGCPC